VLHVQAGSVRILVRNTDSYSHSFTIDDLAVDEYIPPRTDRLLRLRVDIPRTLEAAAARGLVLSCVVTGHEDMVGRVIVES